jgi:NAD(P)-dependent dehydrogenase (short-subunit alcohol dehydrogenase family)
VDVARALLAETEADPDVVEVGYRSGDRFTIAAAPQDSALTPSGSPMSLDESRVFVVTGGAGAITSAIVLDLARASKATFHLLDLLPAPDEATRNEVARLTSDREGLKRDVFERIKAEQGRATPAQVEKRLFELERATVLLDTLREIEAVGGRAHYQSVDVTSADAVASAIAAVVAASPRIDVVLHTAGLERSRTFDTKPQEEFDRVYGVKAFGLYNLLRATRDVPVGALVCFSSVAGRFGNAGQTDYSAANDFMCKASAAFRAARPGSLAVTFDWSAWGGIGMATRGSVPEMMRRAGIEMLDPNEATLLVRQALHAGLSSEVVVGRRLGVLLQAVDADGGLDERAAMRVGEGRNQGLPMQSVKLNKHTGVEIAVSLDPKKEAYLFDHRIDGTPVLPGVMGIETFAEAATLLAPGYVISAMEHVRFLAPMKYFRNEARTAVVRALPMRDGDGRLRVKCTLSSSQAIAGGTTKDSLHFVGDVVLEKAHGRDPQINGAAAVVGANGTSHATIGKDGIYRLYFHGPAYQVLSKVYLRADGSIVGTMAEGLPADRSNLDGSWLFTPRLIELCFQTAGVYEIGVTGRMGLPSVVDRVVVHDAPAALTSLVAEVRSVRGSGTSAGESMAFDARVTGPEGRVYVELTGYRTSTLPDNLPDADLAPFRAVAPLAPSQS